ncbi:RNA polymerase Rpc34 subunit, putative [Trypanosoma equiperdum]|uniref:DNA-directed RNA polymerase III subunit RPC6 n=3 Tax=Trypanozoon TaxID=39700 RepID=Q57WC7_TRYB2|nr:hypothetical protein, conserved [Trypanosoma brucei gambiense DAL972]XP_843983.1 hypothetical protein, conserved [Trypanosoma brucei brucei TREU927]AAX70106.1 hypothetical protein, conserved [Trypanosoma brucei]SCU66089.1 RNA polymerase Rpc34 subunit, putative [Trypanosoma equiperdum]AAZ10424.1 hypothetical protein, conserved [Trypanosoma brucei brucei TREU927]CBH10086.1 hypothetical protein, conserved [Trypanosoma brucei gambiense DAL972]|eukprot:XP_011772376.1 hypothetical protein, conserved [Trypanosoma brucei gambiense DAL972]
MTSVPGVNNAEQRILASLALAGQGALLLATLQQDLGLHHRTMAAALRGLMEGGRVVLRHGNREGDMYVALVNSMPEGPSLVLDAIRASGNSGIDQAALCSSLRLPKGEIIKSLQMLLSQKRIKERRCFSNRAKRIYLLFEFEPSDEVTGGTFYGGEDSREMDIGFVDEMRRRIMLLVAQRHSVSLEQITQHLQEARGGSSSADVNATAGGTVVMTTSPNGTVATLLGDSTGSCSGGGSVGAGCVKRISQRDAQLLVQTLVLDGLLDCVTPSPAVPAQYQLATGRNVMRHFSAVPTAAGAGSGTKWVPAPVSQPSAWAMPAVGLPCMGCAQLHVCTASGNGVVNPRNCAYLKEWMS